MTILSKKIGAGLAIIALIGPGIGIGLVYSSLIRLRKNHQVKKGKRMKYAILGFALVEVIAVIAILFLLEVLSVDQVQDLFAIVLSVISIIYVIAIAMYLLCILTIGMIIISIIILGVYLIYIVILNIELVHIGILMELVVIYWLISKDLELIGIIRTYSNKCR